MEGGNILLFMKSCSWPFPWWASRSIIITLTNPAKIIRLKTVTSQWNHLSWSSLRIKVLPHFWKGYETELYGIISCFQTFCRQPSKVVLSTGGQFAIGGDQNWIWEIQVSIWYRAAGCKLTDIIIKLDCRLLVIMVTMPILMTLYRAWWLEKFHC
jgi:hypothetical protein